MDFLVHNGIVLLLMVFYGYYSLGMDDDPAVCWAPLDNQQEVVADAEIVKMVGEEGYEDVGHQFGTCFDAMFFSSCALLIAQSMRVLATG